MWSSNKFTKQNMIQKNMINKYVLYAQIETTLSNAMALHIVSQAQKEKRGQGKILHSTIWWET